MSQEQELRTMLAEQQQEIEFLRAALSTRRNSFKEIKNYLHNELALTESYVRDIVREAVNKKIAMVLAQGSMEQRIHNAIMTEIYETLSLSWGSVEKQRSAFRDKVSVQIAQQIAQTVSKDLTIEFKVNAQNKEGEQ